ncbi:MAG: cytidylyltransferase family protein [Crenarchaeota archaeon]|nr:cytidylyltransferase family protein [Thermoproteota archaeon]
MDDRERIEAYITNLERAVKSLEETGVNEKYRVLLENAKAYLNDAKYYLSKNDYFTALACVAYGEGLIDSLRHIGEIDIDWRPLSSLLSRPKVLVAGSFEILHPGHIYLLEKAWEMGRVYVIVSRDSNFEKFKGRKPAIPDKYRVEIISSIRYVHEAILGDEKDYLKPVTRISPDIILLGPDQWPDKEKLEEELRRRGLMETKVVRLEKPYRDDICRSSKIIKRILEIHGCIDRDQR